MKAVLPERNRVTVDETPPTERIRSAALKSFAAHGTAATSLRTVADAAGVSVGLVQHHFTNKAGLIQAVDDYVMAIVVATISQPIPPPPADSVAEMSSRVTTIMAEYPEIADYVGRALLDGSPLGTAIFDTLTAFGIARWNQRSERGEMRPEIDVTWGALNSLVLALGSLILRKHVERQLPEPLTAPNQLARWERSVNMLLRDGLFRRLG
ncbi:TetR/AcrR family transcriptional regulator [Mycobacterium sp. NPDC048908]|uniref:TetR/AcrR family transcriptional regulator n=1 Tax=Mycobacterium sp. NPDC048908 TaxID=3364292 RepID=UPI0037212A24